MRTESNRYRYYVVEVCYVGINCDAPQWADFDRYEVRTETPINTNGDVQLWGWLGTCLDISRTAHGAYESEAAACAAVQRILSDAGDVGEMSGPPWLCAGGWRVDDAPSPDPTVCIVYRAGESEPLTREALASMVWETLDVWPDIEDIEEDGLREAAEELADLLSSEGYRVPVRQIADMMRAELN
ncbi:hypothetical protein [Thiolapillus sp.]|uniref:hypothetical protein n=1 Tax=Thiolapillus sp. TaxID=2017437 RepID=UPI003AF5166C